MLFANEGVSIHAPWEGCDVTISALVKVKRCFNSRTLGRVRRVPLRVVSSPGDVSIHAPWEGCDSGVGRYTPTSLVSIHAPWEGCDSILICSCWSPIEFQFTHPGKGATVCTHLGLVICRVSIHAPWEGCDTDAVTDCPTARGFQFTHPGKGATRGGRRSSLFVRSFNSRTLGRVRQLQGSRSCDHPQVSIHAPWEGCDRAYQGNLGLPKLVSIHAPWEGCDGGKLLTCAELSVFQFTHPGKGATR